ncbi:MAG TPA: CPBP family intramembrane glutamic endopeptidase [Anaerolineales bacterium]
MKLSSEPQPDQHPLSLSIALHLLPGLLAGVVFVLAGPAAQKLNLPPFMAFCFADLVILLPLIWGLLLYQGYKKNGRLSLQGVVLYREKLPWTQYLLFVPVVFFASGLIILALNPLSNSIRAGLFGWWPPALDMSADLSPYSRSALILSYLVNFLVISLIAPITEEVYFRGYLLPRLSRFGLWAVPINSILFALFHVWSPWMAVARALGLLPLIFVTVKKKNIYVGMIAHILVNTLDVLTGIAYILNRF